MTLLALTGMESGGEQPCRPLAAGLAHRIVEVIRSQADGAGVLSMGRPDGFTVDRLLRFLNRLGQDVEVAVRDAAWSGKTPGTRVVSA